MTPADVPTITTFDQYQKYALPLAKRQGMLFDLQHAQLGIASEGGEIADQLKRHIAYGTPLDLINLREEIGDVQWYLSLLADAIGSSLEDCATANIRKLAKRYPDGFSAEAAVNRDTGAERAVLEEGRIAVTSKPLGGTAVLDVLPDAEALARAGITNRTFHVSTDSGAAALPLAGLIRTYQGETETVIPIMSRNTAA